MVKARNTDFQNATGEVVAHFDDDVVVGKDWAKCILESYEDKRVGGVVGRVISYDDGKAPYLSSNYMTIGKVFCSGLILCNFDIPTQRPIEVDTLTVILDRAQPARALGVITGETTL